MKLKKFDVVCSNQSGGSSITVSLCAFNEKNVVKSFSSPFIKVLSVSDVTADYPISLFKVANALRIYGFGEKEIAFITSALDLSSVGSFDGFTAD